MRQVTVVTGGSRGIGAATARRLATAGHDLAISYLCEAGDAEAVAEAVTELGRRCLVVQVDTSFGAGGEYVHYAATKAAVDTLTIGLAQELAPDGIRVNAVAPGLVRTEIHERGARDPGRLERLAPRIPMGRAGEPDEVAAPIVWLLGPEASYTTGAILRVAGGR